MSVKLETPKTGEPDEPAAAVETLDVGPLTGMVGYALRRAQLAVFADFIRALDELSLRPAQFSVLIMLAEHPGSTQSAVAQALGIQRANFVSMINELERRGLARREPSPTDKRSHALHLTAKGRDTLARARALAAAHEAHQVERLGPGGIDQLLALLDRLKTDD